MDEIVLDLKKGKRSAIAHAITMIENDPILARRMMKKIFHDSKKRSIVIGITGPAGSGKSSLIDLMALYLQKKKNKPAILAVDPTSSITGGAMLGDRVRMVDSTDSGIFMRSLASRNATGAVAVSVRDSIRVLEYAGFNPILIESVGAGQTEIAISQIVDVTIVVFTPNTGDSIQAIKAGLTEIGDVYVVNKSDLPGSDQLYNAVCDYISDPLGSPVIKTSAKRRTGISSLVNVAMDAASKKIDDPKLEFERMHAELSDIVLNIMSEKMDLMTKSEEYLKLVKRVHDGKVDPYSAASRLARRMVK